MVLASARQVRRVYRKADTSGEVFERWIDRQIDRKTRITGKSVAVGLALFRDYFSKTRDLETAMADLAYVATEVY